MAMRQIKGVIFDWAGTTVDFACLGPLAVISELFKSQKLSVSLQEARKDMGLLKIDHIRNNLLSEKVKPQFKALQGREPTEADVKQIYNAFEPAMLKIIPNYSDPIPGIFETIQHLRSQKIKVGSTTGYTKEMMALLAPIAKSKGYAPDFIISSNEVPQGRPFPWMIFRNAEALGVPALSELLKVGDTLVDIEEGKNAGIWSAGVIEGSSLLGLSQQELAEIPASHLEMLKKKAREEYFKAGADFVINSIREVPFLLESANKKLASGENPGGLFKLEEQPLVFC